MQILINDNSYSSTTALFVWLYCDWITQTYCCKPLNAFARQTTIALEISCKNHSIGVWAYRHRTWPGSQIQLNKSTEKRCFALSTTQCETMIIVDISVNKTDSIHFTELLTLLHEFLREQKSGSLYSKYKDCETQKKSHIYFRMEASVFFSLPQLV